MVRTHVNKSFGYTKPRRERKRERGGAKVTQNQKVQYFASLSSDEKLQNLWMSFGLLLSTKSRKGTIIIKLVSKTP